MSHECKIILSNYRGTDRYQGKKFCNTVWYIIVTFTLLCLDSINTSIHISLYPLCSWNTILYAIAHWLSFGHMSSYESITKQAILRSIFFSRRSIWVLLELVRRWTQHLIKIDQEKCKIEQIWINFGTQGLPDLLCKHWFSSSVWHHHVTLYALCVFATLLYTIVHGLALDICLK